MEDLSKDRLNKLPNSSGILSAAAIRAGEVYDRLILEKAPEAAFLEGKPSPFLLRAIPYYMGPAGIADVVVDMGCGPGRQLGALLPYSNIVVGFDPSQVSLQVAGQRFDHLKKNRDPMKQYNHASFRLGDMETFVENNVIRAGEADAIVAISVINHATHDVIKHTYDQAYEALKPGGYFFYTMISKNNPQYQPDIMDKGDDLPLDEETYYPRSGIDGDIAHHFSDEEELIQDLTDSGFTVYEITEDLTGDEIGGRSGGHYVIVARKPLPEGVMEIPARLEKSHIGGSNGRQRHFVTAAGHVLQTVVHF